MTDKDSSLHVARSRNWRRRLDAHRRTRRKPGRRARPMRRKIAASRLGCRPWGLRMPGWRLPFNPCSCSTAGIRGAQTTIRRRRGSRGVAALRQRAVVAARQRPIMLDLVTPWLTAAIEQNLGSRYRVEVGGTQLERDAQGRHGVASAATSCCATPPAHRRGGAQGGGWDFRSEPLIASPAPKASGWSMPRDDPHRPMGRSTCWRRRPAVRHHRAGRSGTIEPAAIARAQAPARPAAPSNRRRRTPGCSRCSDDRTQRCHQYCALLAWIDELGKLGLDPPPAASTVSR